MNDPWEDLTRRTQARTNHQMSDQTAKSRTNATEYTVSEISGALKRTVEDAFGNVRVRGEISGYRGPHSSGHAYFSLKDDRAKIDAVVWRTAMIRLKFRPEEGMEVIATGKLTTYPGKSSYQIVIENLEPAGAGALMALLEERKRKLAAEGPVRAGQEATPAAHADGDRGGDVADRCCDPRHHPPHQGPISADDHRLACARSRRDVRSRGDGGGGRVQRAAGGRADPTAGRADRGARRRQPRGSVGLQRRGAGAGSGGIRDFGDLGGRTRNRLDADRLRRRPPSADTNGRGRNGGAGEGRTRGDARWPCRAAARLHDAKFRPQANGAQGGGPRAALARPVAGAAATPLRRGDKPAWTRLEGEHRTQAGAVRRRAADAGDAVAAHRRRAESRQPRSFAGTGSTARAGARAARKIRPGKVEARRRTARRGGRRFSATA